MSTTDITLSAKSLQSLRDLLRHHRDEFRDDMDKMLGRMGHSTGGSFGGLGPGAGSKPLKKELELMIKTLGRVGQSLSAYEKYMLQSAKDQVKAINEKIKAEEEARKNAEENSDALNENTEELEKHRRQQERNREGLVQFAKGVAEGSIAVAGFRQAVEEMRTSYKLGFNWNPVTDALNGIKMGMDPKEMMEFQATFRRTSNAMSGGIDGFNKVVAQNQSQMLQYTGSLKAAAAAMGNMYELSNSMGLNFKDVGKSADDLFSQFKRMQSATSLTVDQFTDLAKSLLDDQDIRTKLLNLQTQQRSVYVQSLLKQHDLLMAQGMTFDAAKRLVNYVEKASNKDPMERMKQGASLLQVAKLMGFSNADAQSMRYLFGKRNKSEQENTKFIGLMTDLQKRLVSTSNVGMENDATGVKNSELIINRLLGATGLDLSAYDDAALQNSAKRDPAAMAQHQVDLAERQASTMQSILAQAVKISDYLGAWSNAAIGVVGAAIFASAMNRKGGMVDGLLDRIFGRGNGPGPGGGPGGNPPGGGGAGGWLKSWGGRVAGRAAGGLGIGAVGMIGAGMIDPNSFSDPNSRDKAALAKSALNYGSMGAGVGFAMGGPVGAAAGAAVGALGGTVYELVRNANDFDQKAKDMMRANSQIQSAQSLRISAEKDSAQSQIDFLLSQGKLTDANRKQVEELTKKVEDLNKAQTVEETKSQLLNIKSFGDVGREYLKQGVGSTADIAKTLGGLDNLGMSGGVTANSKAAFAGYIASHMDNLSASDRRQALDLTAAVRDGQDVNVPTSLRPLFSDAANSAFGDLMTRGAAVSGAIPATMTKDQISATVASTQTDINNATAELADLKKQLADKQSLAVFDESGSQMAEVLRIQQQIDTLEKNRAAAEGLANMFDQASNGTGNRYLNVRLDAEQLQIMAKSALAAGMPKPSLTVSQQ